MINLMKYENINNIMFVNAQISKLWRNEFSIE